MFGQFENNAGASSGAENIAGKKFEINENGEVVLSSTGKRIKLRSKTGAHHMVENRLLAACVPRASEKDDMGINVGDMVAMGDIRAVVSIEAINGRPVAIPGNLSGVYEIMSEFIYDNDVDEWSDFKLAVAPDKDKIEEMAKNLRGGTGSETESGLPIGAERE